MKIGTYGHYLKIEVGTRRRIFRDGWDHVPSVVVHVAKGEGMTVCVMGRDSVFVSDDNRKNQSEDGTPARCLQLRAEGGEDVDGHSALDLLDQGHVDLLCAIEAILEWKTKC